jgi:hypothetical protein
MRKGEDDDGSETTESRAHDCTSAWTSSLRPQQSKEEASGWRRNGKLPVLACSAAGFLVGAGSWRPRLHGGTADVADLARCTSTSTSTARMFGIDWRSTRRDWQR